MILLDNLKENCQRSILYQIGTHLLNFMKVIERKLVKITDFATEKNIRFQLQLNLT